MAPTQERINDWFTHHPPKTELQIEAYRGLRDAGRIFASHIIAVVPDGPEQDEAIKSIRAAVMWANAGIACNEPKFPVTERKYPPGFDPEYLKNP